MGFPANRQSMFESEAKGKFHFPEFQMCKTYCHNPALAFFPGNFSLIDWQRARYSSRYFFTTQPD